MQMLNKSLAGQGNQLYPASNHQCKIYSACKHKPFCPDLAANGIGIDYGECYVLALSNRIQLGRLRENDGMYEAPGFFTDLPFKVCDQDRQCSKTGPVGIKEPFTLWDVLGREEWENGLRDGKDKGFFSRGMGPHEKIRTDPNNVATFAGKPSCFDGQYAICVGGHGEGDVGVGPACPADRIGFKTNYRNSRICQRSVFKEITCPDLCDDVAGEATGEMVSQFSTDEI